MSKYKLIFVILFISAFCSADILIPMDNTQTDHLKAYGVAFKALKNHRTVKWLLNYRGGSFLVEAGSDEINDCKINGVLYNSISQSEIGQIMLEIEQSNMESVLLEKEPRIAVYTPPTSQPWDDAVTLVLKYADIEYDTVWDREVLEDKLNDYDWIHLHHEDFTGQYGKFYASFRNYQWYKDEVATNEKIASELGFDSVWKLKHAVAEKIRSYVVGGGFLFAMCAATDTYDIALSAKDVDICESVYDNSGVDPNYPAKLDFDRTFAFTDFSLETSPMVYEFSSIDGSDYAKIRGAEEDYFVLFDFSAKYDQIPTMLTQNHTEYINGFLGQTTSFIKKYIKKSVIIMGDVPESEEAKYIHGNIGKGTFTFYGGHDPEDYQHKVGDPPTVLDLHKNSPGYRLILNNVLFPAAQKKKLKT